MEIALDHIYLPARSGEVFVDASFPLTVEWSLPMAPSQDGGPGDAAPNAPSDGGPAENASTADAEKGQSADAGVPSSNDAGPGA